MTGPRERSDHRPAGIFDVRDHYREQQLDDGRVSNVPGPVRFAVAAVVTPEERVEPRDWVLLTRRTASGLSVFRDRVVEGRRSRVLRTLPRSATSVELRVSSPRFQTREAVFDPSQQHVLVALLPGVDYPFDAITPQPGRPGPSLLRGSVLDEDASGVAEATVEVAEGSYEYRTEPDGAFVVVLPDTLPWVDEPGPSAREVLEVEVQVTLTPTTWETAEVLPDPGGADPWVQAGLVLSRTVTAVRGATTSVPQLRLRLT